jgi:5,10-methenyltetrahydromethanopterin hydrogenase
LCIVYQTSDLFVIAILVVRHFSDPANAIASSRPAPPASNLHFITDADFLASVTKDFEDSATLNDVLQTLLAL